MQRKLAGRGPPRSNEARVQPVSSTGQGEQVSDQNTATATSNRNLKYLLTQLRSGRNPTQKGEAMLSYLYGCSFNAALSPHGIIRFSDDEALELARFVTEAIENEEIDEPEVRFVEVQKLRLHKGT